MKRYVESVEPNMASKEEVELSKSGTEDGEAGIPNLAFQPYPEDPNEAHSMATTNDNNNTESNQRSTKYGYKQFLPFAPR